MLKSSALVAVTRSAAYARALRGNASAVQNKFFCTRGCVCYHMTPASLIQFSNYHLMQFVKHQELYTDDMQNGRPSRRPAPFKCFIESTSAAAFSPVAVCLWLGFAAM